MLEKPDLKDKKIIACMQDVYGLDIIRVSFLPLGADRNTAVYRVFTEDESPYFLKLRKGFFNEISVTLPKFLIDQGIKQIIPPLPTKNGQLWTNLDAYKVILYPYVDGHNGYEVSLSNRHWADFGKALKSIHTAEVPPNLTRNIPKETYAVFWRDMLKTFLDRIETVVIDETVAVKVSTLLKSKRNQIFDLIRRAERLAQILETQSPELIVCHSDMHAGNFLIGANGDFYIVDWDDPILAPKERDLMYIGGGLAGSGRTPQEEETLFYKTYGPVKIDPIALAYYRYERIIQDIIIFCQDLLLTDEGGRDREQSYQYLKANFLPNGVLEIAYQSDKTQAWR